MQTINGLKLPESLAELVDPSRAALLIYDMQVGIVPHVTDAANVIESARRLREGAHRKGVRVFFSRHFSLPLKSAGVAQLRSAMQFQRVSRVEDIRPHFVPGSPEFAIVDELRPHADDVVFDKLGMSFFVGTPLEFSLRDLGLTTVIVAGCVAEIGVEPTVRHALDLGFQPVVVKDACGSLSAANHGRVMQTLGHVALVSSVNEVLSCWR